jgi:hypothetical protein
MRPMLSKATGLFTAAFVAVALVVGSFEASSAKNWCEPWPPDILGYCNDYFECRDMCRAVWDPQHVEAFCTDNCCACIGI